MAEARKRYYILVRDRAGYMLERRILSLGRMKSTPTQLLKGEILEALPETEQPNDSTRIVLAVIDREKIRLECHTEDIARLTNEDANLLLAICSVGLRYQCYIDRKRLDFGRQISPGSQVFVEVKGFSKKLYGTVWYVGELERLRGTMFGVELTKNPGQGTSDGTFRKKRYFNCALDSGVFVALDKLTPFEDSDSKVHVPDHRCGSGTGKLRGKQLFVSKKDHASVVDIETVIPEKDFDQDAAEDVTSPDRGEMMPRSMGYDPSRLSDLEAREAVEIPHGFEVGDMVELPMAHGLPRYGVIKWIGILPDIKDKLVAGLELEDEQTACTDGTFNGQRYFTCPSGRGFFTLLSRCRWDSRFRRNSPISDSDYQPCNDSSVPPEILARGPRAQRAYERALQIGKVKVYRGRIMILGQGRAGKTSLKKSLLGLPFDPQENSTIGVEVDPSRCKLDVAQIKNWEPIEGKKLDVSDFAEYMAKLVARDLNEIVDQEKVSSAGPPSQEELLHNNLPTASATVAVAVAAAAAESTSDTIMVKEVQEESSDDSDLKYSYQAELNIGSTSVVPNDVIELVVRYLKNLKLEEDIKGKEVVLTLWDFAGQHLYYASHSVFLSRRAIYILVYNLQKSICAKAEPRVRQGTHDVVLDNPNNETNLDHLLSWLVSVHAIVPQADQIGKDLDSQATSVPYLRPPVIIVGTNADQPFEDPRATEKCIQRSVSGKTYEKHVIRPFFAVDNTKSNKDLGVQELRRKIMEVLNQEPYMGEEVPLRWFNFEKVVEALVAKGTYHMDLTELLTVTRQVCRIYDGDELTTMLNFYHDLGVIVRHRQTVVLQAQWLIDLFKQLITVRPFDEVDPLFSECWLELEQSGILRMALIDHIFAEFIQKGLSKQDILDMMEVYGLVTKFFCWSAESEQEQTKYFVPSQLRSSPSGLCEMKPSESDPCPLYLHFRDGFVPNGFFPQLLSKCIQWCSKQRLKGPPQLFQNGARLLIGVHDIFELILLCRKRFIKVLLKKKTSSNSSAGTCATRLMANKVRDSLEEMLQSLSRELSWLCNLRYELCVLCASCSEQCRKHGLVSCDHDDCQHLLQVTPGEELFCLRSFCDNTVKVHGLEKWFHLTEADEAKMDNMTAKASPVLDPHIVRSFTASTSVEDEVVMDRTLSFKSGVPSSSDLLLVASELGSSWKMLGRILCLSKPVLEQIEEDERHLTEKCYAVLLKWKQKDGPAASYECLAQALQHPILGKSELATKYCHLSRETENVATQKTDSHLSDPQDSVEMAKNNKEIGLQCSLNNGDMEDRESVLSKEET